MRPAVTRRSRSLGFNITPLIDVVFLLIIFFLAASHLARIQSSEEVNLPEATQGEDTEPRTVRQIVVTITADRGAFIAGRPIDASEFERLLISSSAEASEAGPVEVSFRVDKRVAGGDFDPYLIACARAGVTHLGFKVLPR